MLLNIDLNAKTVKGQKKGYLTAIMYLSSGNTSGYEVCPCRSAACSGACLVKAGRGRWSNVEVARIARTKLFFENRDRFFENMYKEIDAFLRKAARKKMTPCIRLNGTSDISWEDFGIMQDYSNIQFYDYTKIPERMFNQDLPDNYYLLFSRSEDNDVECRRVLEAGKNVVVVFENREYPETFWGHPVVNGDLTDLRFLDPTPSIVSLYAKGPAKKCNTGFVMKTCEEKLLT